MDSFPQKYVCKVCPRALDRLGAQSKSCTCKLKISRLDIADPIGEQSTSNVMSHLSFRLIDFVGTEVSDVSFKSGLYLFLSSLKKVSRLECWSATSHYLAREAATSVVNQLAFWPLAIRIADAAVRPTTIAFQQPPSARKLFFDRALCQALTYSLAGAGLYISLVNMSRAISDNLSTSQVPVGSYMARSGLGWETSDIVSP